MDEKVICTQICITKQLIKENKALLNHLAEARKHNEFLTGFLSVAVHELKTPLTNVLLSASLIERYYESLDRKKIKIHVKKIKTAIGEFTRVLNTYLPCEIETIPDKYQVEK